MTEDERLLAQGIMNRIASRDPAALMELVATVSSSDLALVKELMDTPFECEICHGEGFTYWHSDSPKTKPCPNGCWMAHD